MINVDMNRRTNMKAFMAEYRSFLKGRVRLWYVILCAMGQGFTARDAQHNVRLTYMLLRLGKRIKVIESQEFTTHIKK